MYNMKTFVTTILVDQHRHLRIILRFITHQIDLMFHPAIVFHLRNLYFLILSLPNPFTKNDYEQCIQT